MQDPINSIIIVDVLYYSCILPAKSMQILSVRLSHLPILPAAPTFSAGCFSSGQLVETGALQGARIPWGDRRQLADVLENTAYLPWKPTFSSVLGVIQ